MDQTRLGTTGLHACSGGASEVATGRLVQVTRLEEPYRPHPVLGH